LKGRPIFSAHLPKLEKGYKMFRISTRKIYYYIYLLFLVSPIFFLALNLAAATEQPDFTMLVGEWVRPDGGYVIRVQDIKPMVRLTPDILTQT